MREFFRSWRRKVGVVALVMACVLAASWIRSLAASDTVWIRIGDRYQVLHHCDGGITLDSYEIPSAFREVFPSFARHSQGFGPDYEQPLAYVDSGGWMVPYSLLAIPMTLLSACLILWKPRPKDNRHA